MLRSVDRREFLVRSAGAVAAVGLSSALSPAAALAQDKAPLYEISLAEWSLHRMLFEGKKGGKDLNLEFARMAKEDYGILAIEYVNQFFKDKAKDQTYLADLKKRADDLGVKQLLIMIDGEGKLGDKDDAKRTQAVENHYKWVEAAKFLGCHSIRVNAGSDGTYDEQLKLAVDGLGRLSEFGAKHQINVIVENHGGLSSNGEWLAAVIKTVNNPCCGTLPDFGNFGNYDRYKGVKELMPFAKGVSAKSHDFDEQGNEVRTDYRKMMKIVLDAGYKGYVGVEYEGGKLSEADGIKATKKLLETVRTELSKA